jgi:hypothetical protein
MPLEGQSPFRFDGSAIAGDSTGSLEALIAAMGFAYQVGISGPVDVSDLTGLGTGWIAALEADYVDPVVDVGDLTGLGSGWSTALESTYVSPSVTLSSATAIAGEVITKVRTLTVGGVSFKVAELE